MSAITPLPKSTVPAQLLHRDVKDRLRQRMEREWPAGSRLPSILELSQQFGVGLQTAHKAVRELVDEGVLVSRPRHGTFVLEDAATQGSSQDKNPQAHVTQAHVTQAQPRGMAHVNQQAMDLRGRSIDLCYGQSADGRTYDGMLDKMIHALEQEFSAAGCEVHATRLERENKWIHSTQSDAAVIINPYSVGRILPRPGQSLLVLSTASHVPVGVVADYDVVTVDHEQGAMMVGHQLRQAGCKSVAYIGRHMPSQPTTYVETSAKRLGGLEAGWGSPVPAENRFHVFSYAVEDGAQAAAKYAKMKDRPQAVFAASDELAVGFVLGLIPFGLKAGRDYSIVGFDGQQIGRELSQGALSTVQVPAALMGKRGGELLLDRLRHPGQPVRRLSLGCSWFQGATIQTTT